MTTYTSEQLSAMTQIQLMEIVMQAQVEVPVVETVVTDTTETAPDTESTDIEKSIEQVKTAITNLETIGAEIFENEIASLKEKLATLEAEAIEKANEEVEEVKTEVISFYDKYRTEIIVVAAIVLVHVLGKVGF